MATPKDRRWYFALMGFCLLLILLAWNLVRLRPRSDYVGAFWSVPAAVAMSVVAMVIPPVAAFVGNRSGTGG